MTYVPKTVKLQAVEEELVARDVAHQMLKDNLVKGRDRMKKFADLHITERDFAVGDRVFLHIGKPLQVGDYTNSHPFFYSP